MNRIVKSISVVLLLIFFTSIIFLTGCDGKADVSGNFYKSLSTAVQTNLAGMKKDLAKYDEALAKKAEYDAKVKSLESAFVDVSGFWQFDAKGLVNLQNDKITLQTVNTMYLACREMNLAKDGQNWCAICDKNRGELKTTIEKLEKLASSWKSSYQSWNVTEYQKGVYSIAGYGLGFGQDLDMGQWYFMVTDNSTKAVDPGAQSVARLLEKQQAYDEVRKATAKVTFNCVPPPSTDRRNVDYWIIRQFPGNYTDGSKEVNELLLLLPDVNKFWKQLSEIGYRCIFKGIGYVDFDKVTGKKNYMVIIQVNI